METIRVPELEYLLNDIPCEPYPYTKTFQEAKHDPCFVVHTSGSTGMPKPSVWTNWSINTADSHNLVAPLDGRPTLWSTFSNKGKRNYCDWSIFNGSGLGIIVMATCFSEMVIVLGPPEHQFSADSFNELLEYAKIDSASCLPTTLETIAKRPDILEKLNRLDVIAYVGGIHTTQPINFASAKPHQEPFRSTWEIPFPVTRTCATS